MENTEKVVLREADSRAIAEFRLIDDTFMSAVFDGRIQETELLLKIVLEKEDITVISSKAQYYLSNIYGKEVRLDILARDSMGKAYNVEVQKVLSGAPVQRARFNGAMVDVTLLKKGQEYVEMPERYTIFITEDDKFQMGLPAYHVENTVKELDHAPLGDGSHIVYINGQYRNTDTPIGKLMHDFFCKKAEDMLNPLLKERVHYLKETEGGKKDMCEIMEGLMEQRVREKQEILARKAIIRGKLTLEEIAEDYELPLEVVQEIAEDSQKAVTA
ncbi:MAG: PD-(D/E)XK nuclease family transposase [Lachnospiraceae bacterium]|nr:PD-(D/E)XK nuclease family transposase [Lachnospiraceae bacterium]